MSGRDPFAIFHDLDDRFVPMGGGEPMPPPYISRRLAVLKSFGKYEVEFRSQLAGAKVPAKKRPRRSES